MAKRFEDDDDARDDHDNYVFDVAHDQYGLAGIARGDHLRGGEWE